MRDDSQTGRAQRADRGLLFPLVSPLPSLVRRRASIREGSEVGQLGHAPASAGQQRPILLIARPQLRAQRKLRCAQLSGSQLSGASRVISSRFAQSSIKAFQKLGVLLCQCSVNLQALVRPTTYPCAVMQVRVRRRAVLHVCLGVAAT